MRPPEEGSDFKGLISNDLAPGFGAFRADGHCGHGFGAGSSFAPPAGSVLGPDHDPGDRAVIAGSSVRCFVAAFRRDGGWSGSWRDCGELLRAAPACIRRRHIHPGTNLRRGALGPKRIPVWGRYAGDCAVDSADRSSMANRRSSVC